MGVSRQIRARLHIDIDPADKGESKMIPCSFGREEWVRFLIAIISQDVIRFICSRQQLEWLDYVEKSNFLEWSS